MPKKKKYTGGAESRRRRGLRPILTAVRPDVHTAVTRAASLANPPQPVTEWSASVLEAAARQVLRAAGLPWPQGAEENPEKSAS